MEIDIRHFDAFFKIVDVIAELSYAKRAKVGAIIIKDDRVLSTGFNGMPSGLENECEFEHQNQVFTKKQVIHAEVNAIAFAAKNGISTDGSIMFCSYSPCIDCAKLIIQSGIRVVAFKNIYRDSDGLNLLRAANIDIIFSTQNKNT